MGGGAGHRGAETPRGKSQRGNLRLVTSSPTKERLRAKDGTLASVLLGEVTRHRVSTFQTQAAKVGRGGGISLYNEASGLVKEELS